MLKIFFLFKKGKMERKKQVEENLISEREEEKSVNTPYESNQDSDHPKPVIESEFKQPTIPQHMIETREQFQKEEERMKTVEEKSEVSGRIYFFDFNIFYIEGL